MVQTPALDVVALGTVDGTIVIHNIKTDTRVLTLKQDTKVTCISFRQGGIIAEAVHTSTMCRNS